MQLYLVQHGVAKSGAEDPERPLSDAGRMGVHGVAAWAARSGLQVDRIHHSGKRRAAETAEILADALSAEATAIDGLKPNDDVRDVANRLLEAQGSWMLVGHLPHLARLAGLLVTGSEDEGIVRFQNGGIVRLSRADDAWALDWIVTPDVVAT